MHIKLVGNPTALTPHKLKLIHQRLTSKLAKYTRPFQTSFQRSALTIKRGSRWGYIANFTMILPKNENIFAQAEGKTISATLVPLRQKIAKQLHKYRARLGINR